MHELLDCLSQKLPPEEELSKKILEAAQKKEHYLLFRLVDIQSKIKKALEVISWSGTIDALMEKKKEFFNAILPYS